MPAAAGINEPRGPRPLATLVVLALIAAAMIVALVRLGTWQVHRLAWKRALIAQVARHLATPPVPAPGPADWSGITPDRDAYRRIRASGRLIPARSSFVLASTERGQGFWMMTPLRTDTGFTLLVNRGFVPPEARAAVMRAAVPDPVTITGLLRVSEPKGGLLRSNDPAADRWYSRDVAAIAARRGLGPVAPYFLDADAAPPGIPAGAPIGGLTVVAFPNNHLAYAITWYGLALMVAGGYAVLLRHEIGLRRAPVA